jgi:type II secretory pathway component GspD/PulD (secretin)
MALQTLRARLAPVAVLVALLPAAARAEPSDEKAVSVEVRVVRVSQQVYDRFSKELGIGDNGAKVANLSDRELFLLMSALQADRATSVFQAPRLLMLDGARGQVTLDPGEKEPSFSFSVRPSVSSDGKGVRLSFRGDLSMFTVGTAKVKRTLRVADGATAVMGGWKTEIAKDCPAEPAVISTIPYLCRLFKNAEPAPEPGRVLFLITPRVISGDEPTPPPPVRATALPVKAASRPSR